MLAAPAPNKTKSRSYNLDKRPIIFVFSHLRWNFVFQRPQHLMTRASRDHDVFFVEEPVFASVGQLPCYERQPVDCGVTVLVPIVCEGRSEAEIVADQRALLNVFMEDHSHRKIILWFYTPMALCFADHLRPALCIYDCMDELSAFRGAPSAMIQREQQLLCASDVVFTGGLSLYEAKRDRHDNLHAFPSSIDAAHFMAARTDGDDPADQAKIGFPRIGFFGVIDERMDIDLVAQLATMRPDWHFVMIGPVVKIDPATLPRYDNIHWLGPKSYRELPLYLAGWNAGFMPFALNESTRFISPTKTPEFLAAGLSLVSTRITDVVSPYGDAGLVEIADGAVPFAAKLAELLSRQPNTSVHDTWLCAVDAHLAGMSWDRTWQEMQALMGAARASAPPVANGAQRSTVGEAIDV